MRVVLDTNTVVSAIGWEGPPRRIIQTENDVVFIYTGGDAGGGYGEFRIIPT